MSPEATDRHLGELWDAHVHNEFQAKDTSATLDTMWPDAYVNHIPVRTGGGGRAPLRDASARAIIPHLPPDTEFTPISRTIGTDRLVDETIVRFTHTIEMERMLPGVAPTGNRVECPIVAIVTFRDGKLFNEHIYWDQASVLVQLGLLDRSPKLSTVSRALPLEMQSWRPECVARLRRRPRARSEVNPSVSEHESN